MDGRDRAGDPPLGRQARTRIGPDEPGGPLLHYLALRFTYKDREQWRELILEGRLLVNDRPAGEGTLLVPGDLLEFHAPDGPEPPVSKAFSVIYEDDALLVVNKPPDLPCHPAGKYFRNTLWGLLCERRPDCEPPLLLNRLDRETSGIVLAAKTRWAARAVGRQFQRKTVGKRYLVLVEGTFPRYPMEAEGIISADPESAVRKRRKYHAGPLPDPAPPGAKACATTFRGLDTFGGISLVEAVPHTGRLHQIRATLHALGYPVVGDKLYGPDETLFLRFIHGRLTPDDRKRLRIPRQALHAAEVHIFHPATGAPLRLSSNLPPDLQALREKEGEGISP